jgi:Zn-dependent protease
MDDFDPLSVLFFVVTLVPAVVLHELAHGVVADRLGDSTPRLAGRLTLNPVKHADPFGTLILPGLLLLPYLFGEGGPVFGYAKPMPVNTSNMRNPDRKLMVIALGGPLTNLFLAVLGCLGLRFVSPEAGRAIAALGPVSTGQITEVFGPWAGFFSTFALLNVLLAVFNILPIPPLDGSKVVAMFLPPRAREVYRSLEVYGALFMLALFIFFPGAIFGIVYPIVTGLPTLLLG